MLRATATITSNATPTTRGIVFMAIAMLIFACQDAIGKYLVGTYSVPQVMWIRYIIFLIIAYFIIKRKGGFKANKSKTPYMQLIRCGIMIIETAVIVSAFKLMPMADVHAIFALCPLIVTALSVVFLKEHVGIRRWAAVVVGFGGMLIILRPGMAVIEPGAMLAVLGAVLFAMYVTLTRKVSAVDSSETSFLYLAVIGFAVTSVLGPMNWVMPDAFGMGLMLLLASMAACAHLLLMKALEAAPASLLQPLNYTLLIWATIIGFIVFGDFPDIFTIIGALVIAISGLYTIYREQKLARKNK